MHPTIFLILVALMTACAPSQTPLSATPVNTAAVTPPLPAPTTTTAPLPVSSATFTPQPQCPPGETVCVLNWHFPFQRPIAAEYNQRIDFSYRFGSTQNRNRVIHHGVEFVNSPGTPVLAIAAGEVVFAGWDDGTRISPWTDYYGNVVVIAHGPLAGYDALYSVYAHLSQINVAVGQGVSAGEMLGLVGATGGALGNHLHFEVRANDWGYTDSVNPMLFVAPLEERGALAFRLRNAAGERLPVTSLRVQYFAPRQTMFSRVYDLETYADDGGSVERVRPHAWLDEHAILEDLPADGRYRLTFLYNGVTREVNDINVAAGRLTLIEVVVP